MTAVKEEEGKGGNEITRGDFFFFSNFHRSPLIAVRKWESGRTNSVFFAIVGLFSLT